MTTLQLDDYERDNLLALLHLIYRGDTSGGPPLGILGTGDWAGQIYWKLAEHGFDPAIHTPNALPEQQIADLKAWWKP